MSRALLTNSRLSAFRWCARLHHYTYELGYRPTDDAAVLRFGQLIHRALEAWWTAPPELRLQMALAALEGEADPFDRVRAEVLVSGYHFCWQSSPYEILAVEAEFETPLLNPATGHASKTWNLAGKIDAIVKSQVDGRTLLVEHKTSGEDIRAGSDYWKRLRLDGQVGVYYEGARSLGHTVDGCLYDVLGKPDLRPYKATPVESRKFTKDGKLYAAQRLHDETPEEFRARLTEAVAAEPNRYFVRGDVVRLEAEMDEAMYDVWQLGRSIREGEVAGRAPRNPGACVRYGRTCAFFDVCCGAASLDDETKFKRSAVIHPELSAKAERGEESKEAAP